VGYGDKQSGVAIARGSGKEKGAAQAKAHSSKWLCERERLVEKACARAPRCKEEKPKMSS